MTSRKISLVPISISVIIAEGFRIFVLFIFLGAFETALILMQKRVPNIESDVD